MSDARQSDIHESIATERERDRYKAALEDAEDDIACVAQQLHDDDHCSECADAADRLAARCERIREALAPSGAKQAEDVEPGLGAVTEADQAARREALKADPAYRRAVDHESAQLGGEF